MMSSIPDEIWTQVTPISALVLILVWLIRSIASGKLRSGITIGEIRADRDARIEEQKKIADDWKTAWEVSEKAREVQTDIAREALDISRSTEAVITGLKSALELSRREVSG